jgi:ferritin-like metal-binding protein YciE
MQTAYELFVHELTDILDAEQKLVEALGSQAEESSRPDLQKAFQSHQAQTQKQVERVQQCFEILGEDPEETECKGIKGLIEEHDSFKEEDPSEDIMDIFNAGAAAKVESYEINAYEGLIRLAGQLELTKVEKLLNQNLKEEQATLKKMQAFENKLKPENLGLEEEAEDEGEDEEDSDEVSENLEAEEDEESLDEASNSSNKRGAKRAGSSDTRTRRGRVA